MIYRPCGNLNPQSPCKHYHHEFVTTTTTNKHGYPLYREEIINVQSWKEIKFLIIDGLFIFMSKIWLSH